MYIYIYIYIHIYIILLAFRKLVICMRAKNCVNIDANVLVLTDSAGVVVSGAGVHLCDGP